jgi:hypothetical protein
MITTAVPTPEAATAPPFAGDDLLEAFSLRMARHGMSVSRSLMRSDRRYAVAQMAQAQTLGDPTLACLAMELFRRFQQEASGVSALH